MIGEVSAVEAKTLVHDGDELAFLDIREAGEFGEGHPLFAVPCPYSLMEKRILDLVPRRSVRLLLIDAAGEIAPQAARSLSVLGYDSVAWVAGGAAGWAEAGFTLYKGVNVPSKTLGELAEAAWHPATIDAETLAQWRQEGRDFHFFDARPPAEYAKMRVPGASCLPNGELAHRFPAVVAAADKPVVVTCAGRTRGIIGVLGLRLAGIEAPVYALENGTQGWQLAGFALERGNTAAPFPALDASQAAVTRARAEALRERHGISTVIATEAAAWRDDDGRTTFLFDLRAPGEIAADPAPAFTPALSGQLVQSTDLWVGVRHARLVLMDDLGLRAAIAAFWLRQLGFEVAVAILDDDFRRLPACSPQLRLPAVEGLSGAEALAKLNSGTASLIDLRSSASFRLGHVAGARWSIRPRLKALDLPQGQMNLLLGDDPSAVSLAAGDLAAAQAGPVRVVDGGHAALVAAGATVVASPDDPTEDEAIDFLCFVHDRHDGNLEASRQYLAWEQGLVAQLDSEERAAFDLDAWAAA